MTMPDPSRSRPRISTVRPSGLMKGFTSTTADKSSSVASFCAKATPPSTAVARTIVRAASRARTRFHSLSIGRHYVNIRGQQGRAISISQARGRGSMRAHKIAAIAGDGIGPEVIMAGLEVLYTCARRDGFELEVISFDWGSNYYRNHGVMMPANGLQRLRDVDAIYFGAVGAPDIPDHVTLWGLRLAICQGLDQYANVRPARLLPGIQGPLRDPGDLDWVIVRENSEGEYAGVGGRVHHGLPEEVATETAVFTRTGITRIMRFAFGLA